MVEGPGATRNGRKIQRVLNRRVLFANIRTGDASDSSSSLEESIVGRNLAEVFTIGKELFLIFSSPPNSSSNNSSSERDDDKNDLEGNDSEIAIRLHFGMNGCLYVSKPCKAGGTTKPLWRQKEEPTLLLTFDNASRTSNGKKTMVQETLPENFFSSKKEQAIQTSSGDVEDCGDSDLRHGIGLNGQVSGTKRKRDSAGNQIRSLSDETTIFDQNLLCVEACGTTINGPIAPHTARSKFARLHPRDACGSNFDARIVYDAIYSTPNSSSLLISDAVLDQTLFPGVGNIIKVEALHLAKVDPRRNVHDLLERELRCVVMQCRKFAMGWLTSGRPPHKLVYNQTLCGTCGNASISMQKLGGAGKGASHTLDGHSTSSNHAYMSRVTFWCRVCQPPQGIQKDAETNHNMMSGHSNNVSPSGVLSESTELLPLSQLKDPSSLPSPGTMTFAVNASAKIATVDVSCPTHGPSSVLLRRVKKPESANRCRLFRTCRYKDCPFFAWADQHLPSCRCQQRAVLKISKTAKTGGRWFLCCGNKSGMIGNTNDTNNGNHSGCDMFLWATSDHLAPFGSSLTPLL